MKKILTILIIGVLGISLVAPSFVNAGIIVATPFGQIKEECIDGKVVNSKEDLANIITNIDEHYNISMVTPADREKLYANAYNLTSPEIIESYEQNVADKIVGNIDGLTEIDDETIEKVDEYVQLTNEGYKLNLPKSVKSEMTSETYESVLNSIENSNEFVAEEGVIIDEENKEALYSVSDTTLMLENGETPMLRANGISKVKTYWWGYKIYMSKTFLRYAGGGVTGAAGYMVNKLKLRHPIAIAAAAAMGMAGVLGTSAKHGYVARITRVSVPFGPKYIVTGVWRQ
ncbi:hypothetical protein [Listeria seeligeri]|uniref:hypothetical protein n=2 Tax=Listeria seeligeri TaxID=1640 RepID=UPI001886C967|nr:hypothetical protein [Listeria seeligeri]MBF2662606.1 hypothetical protein [Listeria seeligeri]MBM5675627.1 hypothetical protein [Listeria seeligeri]